MRLIFILAAAVMLAPTMVTESVAKELFEPKQIVAEAVVAKAKDPVLAIKLADSARVKVLEFPSSDEQLSQLATLDWVKGASLVAIHRASEAKLVLARSLNGQFAARGPSSKILGNLVLAMATVDIETGHVEQALRGFQRAYHIFQAASDGRGSAQALANIGTLYMLAKNFDRAIDYFNQSERAAPADSQLKLIRSNNRGIAYRGQQKYSQAAEEFRSAAAVARAIKNPLFEGTALANLADVQVQAGRFDAAEATVSQGTRISHEGRSVEWSPMWANIEAELALKRGDFGKAVRLVDLVIQQSKTGGSQSLSREFERVAYEVYRASGRDDKALDHLERFKRMDDQARVAAASTNAALMSARFDYANQNTRIANLRKNEAEQEATIQRNQVIFQRRLLAAAALILVMLLIGFLSIRRSRNQVRAANDELTGTNAELERALAARTEFLATTSHEIRTPLNGILGMTQVLLANRALDPDIKGKIELVQGAGETMRALVDDILDVAKIANGELTIHPAEMDLQKLLREAGQVWEAQANTKGVSIAVDLTDAPERIVEDEVRLRQIVFNLMANAVKFTDRGAVRLTAGFTPDSGAAADAAGLLRIEIGDTGIGIPSDKMEDIFESFRQIDGGTTRRHGGTGLGLAICRNLARAMGGDVQVTSILGAGSTFAVELPCAPVARPAARSAPVSLAETRLLLAEANPLARSIQTAVLTPHVDRIVPAGDLSEARAAVSTDEIDIALADAGLFGGDMAQAEQFARIAADHGVPLVLLWPSPDENVRERAKAAGILRIIAKPIPAQEMVAALKDIYMTDGSRQEIAA